MPRGVTGRHNAGAPEHFLGNGGDAFVRSALVTKPNP
jgi:hypothetical protein